MAAQCEIDHTVYLCIGVLQQDSYSAVHWFYEKRVMTLIIFSFQVDKIVKESIKNANNKKLKDKEIKLKANFRR